MRAIPVLRGRNALVIKHYSSTPGHLRAPIALLPRCDSLCARRRLCVTVGTIFAIPTVSGVEPAARTQDVRCLFNKEEQRYLAPADV